MISVNGIPLEINHYPDGTLLLKPPAYNDAVKYITWHYESEEELVALIYVTKHYQSQGKTVELIMPYCPNARMDRVKNPEDVFTLKYFSQIINSLNFRQVHVWDIHSNVAPALIERINVIDCYERMFAVIDILKNRYNIDDSLILFFPDEGAAKRYSGMFELPYTFANKIRDWQNGKIKNLSIVDNDVEIKGKDVLIIDDICSKGGTFLHSAKALKEKGANKIFLYITHCENTILDGELIKSGLCEKIFTTNSILTVKHPLIEII